MNKHLFLSKWGLKHVSILPTEAAAKYLTADGRCIFCEPGELREVQKQYVQGCKGLQVYDLRIEQQRRLVCDSALGQLVLDNPGVVYEAVRLVNNGIRTFVGELHSSALFTQATPGNSVSLANHVVNIDGKYVSNAASFGRLGTVSAERLSETAKTQVPSGRDQMFRQLRGQMNTWLAAFNEPDLPRQMGLHDIFLKVKCSLRSAKGERPNLTPKDLATERRLRENWYDTQKRGRKDNPAFTQKPFASNQPGLISPTVTIAWRDIFHRAGVNLSTMRQEERQRAVDKYLRDVQAMKSDYGQSLDMKNLLFVASASGTTSTLLTSAYEFAPSIETTDNLKRKYLLACVGYLVGGGMHSCDEVFFTGGKAGLPYQAGKYLNMLPQSFLKSEVGQSWKHEFWDLVRSDRISPR